MELGGEEARKKLFAKVMSNKMSFDGTEESTLQDELFVSM